MLIHKENQLYRINWTWGNIIFFSCIIFAVVALGLFFLITVIIMMYNSQFDIMSDQIIDYNPNELGLICVYIGLAAWLATFLLIVIKEMR